MPGGRWEAHDNGGGLQAARQVAKSGYGQPGAMHLLARRGGIQRTRAGHCPGVARCWGRARGRRAGTVSHLAGAVGLQLPDGLELDGHDVALGELDVHLQGGNGLADCSAQCFLAGSHGLAD